MSEGKPKPEKPNEPDPALLAILVCPLTKRPLHYDRQKQELISVDAGLAFPIRDGVPILVHDDARNLEEAELDQYARKALKPRGL